MNGYTGWFSSVYAADNVSAGNYDLSSGCQLSDSGTGFFYRNEVNQACQFVWEVEVLRNTGTATIKPIWMDSATPVYNSDAHYGGGLTAALPLANTRQYVERFVGVVGVLNCRIGARMAVTSTGDFSYRLKVRPYHFTGWVNANLTGSTALTTVEPGIANSPMGRESAASSYADEIKLAKDEIARRLSGAGIDLDKIPTDGVSSIATAVSGANPQQIATYLIPELCDPATYLALSIIHERFATRGDDWDAYKAERYRERYETAFSQALKVLPLNLINDYQLDKSEESVGNPRTLSL